MITMLVLSLSLAAAPKAAPVKLEPVQANADVVLSGGDHQHSGKLVRMKADRLVLDDGCTYRIARDAKGRIMYSWYRELNEDGKLRQSSRVPLAVFEGAK